MMMMDNQPVLYPPPSPPRPLPPAPSTLPFQPWGSLTAWLKSHAEPLNPFHAQMCNTR